jgi:hypothetical protein
VRVASYATVPRTFYRVTKSDPPTRDDFLSHQALGKVPPRGASADLLRSWAGVSVFEEVSQARALAQRLPRIGDHIARIELPDDAPVESKRTGGTPGHHDLWGDPDVLLGFVVPDSTVHK